MILRAMGRMALALVIATLAGCASTRPVVRVPETVRVPVYVQIDPALTAPCPIAQPRDATVREALRVARERRRALEECSARMAQIRAIQGTPTP